MKQYILILASFALLATPVTAANFFEEVGGWFKKRGNEVGNFFSDPAGVKKGAETLKDAVAQADLLDNKRHEKMAVQLAISKQKQDLVRLQVLDCLGTFKLLAGLQTPAGEETVWETRVSSFRSIGPRPSPPIAPVRSEMNAKSYDAAKKKYKTAKSAYASALKSWNAKYLKHLSANQLVLNRNLVGAGQYAFKLVVVPEDTEPAGGDGDWRIRLAATQDRSKGKPLQFKLVERERADYRKLPLGTALPPMTLYFHIKQIE